MKRLWLFAATGWILGISGSLSQAQGPWPEGSEVDHVTDNTVYFRTPGGSVSAPAPFKLPTYDSKFLGLLHGNTSGSPPYIVVSGKSCRDCLQDRNIFILRSDGTRPVQIVYPGKVTDPKSRSLLLDTRVFYGKCLPGSDEMLIVFQKEKVDRKRGLQSSVFIAHPAKDHLDERLLESRLPKIQPTLQRVKERHCFEVEGRNRNMLTGPLSLTPNSKTVDGSDHDDDDVKENRTDDDLEPPSD